MTVQLSVDFNLKDKLHGILCLNDLEHYLKDCISCYTVCVIVICLLYQIMNNTVILKFAVCQISLISPMIKKSDKSPPMMNGDEGGQLSDLIGGDTVLMRGDIRLIGGDPPQSPPPLGKTLRSGLARTLRIIHHGHCNLVQLIKTHCFLQLLKTTARQLEVMTAQAKEFVM